MRKRITTLVACVMVLLGVCAPVAMADANCTGSLADRPASCFNSTDNPSSDHPGFHGK